MSAQETRCPCGRYLRRFEIQPPFTRASVSDGVMRHNAYTLGWEDGAVYRYAAEMADESCVYYPFQTEYHAGLDAGKRARAAAWKRAGALKTETGDAEVRS